MRASAIVRRRHGTVALAIDRHGGSSGIAVRGKIDDGDLRFGEPFRGEAPENTRADRRDERGDRP